MSAIRTHYDNLKVARNAPPEVIRAAYKTLSQKYHPDRNANSEDSQRIMRIINDSYEVLSDKRRRAEHDRWIVRQEVGGGTKQSGNREQATATLGPVSGACYVSELDPSQRKKVISRIFANNAENFSVKTDGVIGNYVWSIILLGWFVFLYLSSDGNRWSEQEIYWQGGITVVVAYLLGRNISWIYAWHKTPLKSRLIVTPLYIIKTCLDQISYWPLWSIKDIKTTHNYKNGSYQSTSVVMNLEGKNQEFVIRSKTESEKFLEQLQAHRRVCQLAAKQGDTSYFLKSDDFASRQSVSEGSSDQSPIKRSRYLVYGFLALVSACFFAFVYQANLDNPVYKAKPKQAYNAKPSSRQTYMRPVSAPNGSPWPTYSAYVPGYEKLQNRGLSNVTVDNTRNDSDVFVKLVYVGGNEAYPARVFFISGGDSFRIPGITAGEYDIRYRDLSTGGLARSESFTLEEKYTGSGTQYSDFRMTLYKVHDGNMQTYPLNEAEF